MTDEQVGRKPKSGAVAERERVSLRARSISPSGIRRFFDLVTTMEDVISLGVGEPDYVTPWNIREAAIYSLEKGYTHYTSNYGLIELREEIAKMLSARYAVRYSPTEEILVTVGVSQALDLAVRAIVDPGDEVVMPDPGYVAYAPCVVLAGGIVVPVASKASNDFAMSAADIEKALSPRTKAIVLGFPNNPTGAVMPHDELVKIARLAQERDLMVISDEIYDRIVYGVKHTCFSSIPGMKERTILLGGFSKSYAMTGWRIGYVTAVPEIMEAIVKIHQYTMMCAPIVAQKGAVEALRHGDEAVEEMVADYGQRRRVMLKGFAEIGLPCVEPRGAFYAFPDVSCTGLDSETFAERLLREARVAVVPGAAFGEAGRNHVRCCFATSLDEIKEALDRMGRFVSGCRSEDQQ